MNSNNKEIITHFSIYVIFVWEQLIESDQLDSHLVRHLVSNWLLLDSSMLLKLSENLQVRPTFSTFHVNTFFCKDFFSFFAKQEKNEFIQH